MKPAIVALIAAFLTLLVISCQNEGQLEFTRYYSGGKMVYLTRCQNCHGANGEGLRALIPPLTDSGFLKRNIHFLPCIVKNGLSGKITLLKKDFDGQMPAAGLSPIEIAQALTYVANSFGNRLGTIPVENVNSDLEKCR